MGGEPHPNTWLGAGHEVDLRDALELIGDGFVVHDRDWRILYLNRAAAEHLRHSRDELLGKVIWDAIPGSGGSELEHAMQRAAGQKEPSEFVVRGPTTLRWLAFRVFPSETRIFVSFRDITEQKHAADALGASEARHRAIFEHAFDAMLQTAPSGEIFAANPAACRLLDRTEEEIRAIGREGIMDPTDARLAAALEERRRTGYARAELRCMRKGGSTFPAEVASVVYLDSEGRERTSLTIRDLSEQKRAQNRLQLLADAGAVLGSSLDVAATIESVTKLLVPRLADQCLLDLFYGAELRRAAAWPPEPKPPDSVTEAIGRVAGGSEPELLTCGEPPCSVILVPVAARDSTLGVLSLLAFGGRPAYDDGDVTVARVIGGRAALAIENARLHEQTMAAKRLRDEVVGIVSHDLRNPLSAILIAVRLLAGKISAPEIGSIERSVKYANTLIGDLLTVAALEAGLLPITRRPESMAEIVEEAVSLQRAFAEARALVLETSIAPELPPVNVDRNRILQVLGNLIGNALKFTPEGGRVCVEARMEGAAVVVAVSDTGPGIAAAELDHIFDRFWQGAHAQRAGTGLGLAIAKGIVEAHGGTIAVASVVGQGATVRFSLPIGPG